MKDTPRKIIRNTLTNTLGFVFAYIPNFFLIPLIVHTLGSELYGGVWVVMGALTGYMGLLDFGTGTAFVKYIAEYHTKDDREGVIEVVNTGVAVYLVVGCVILLIAIFAGQGLLRVIGVPAGALDDAGFVLHVAVLIFVFSNVLSPLTAVLSGLQRMDTVSYVTIATQTLNVVTTIGVLKAGYGIRGLVLNNLAILVVSSLIQVYFSFRYVPYLVLGFRRCRMQRVKQFFAFGVNLQISKLAQLVLFQTDRIINLRFFGPGASTQYDIGARVSGAARVACSLLVSALIPAVAELDTRQHKDLLLQLHERGSRYLVSGSAFVFVFIVGFAPEILQVWMGEQREISATILRILAIGYFANIITGVASTMAVGIGRTDFERRAAIFSTVINILAVIGCSLLFGSLGVAIGASFSLVLGSIYFTRLVHSHLQIGFRKLGIVLIKVGGISMIAFAIGELVKYASPLSFQTRIEGITSLSLILLVYAIVYLILLVRMDVIDEYDRNIVKSIYRRVVAH